jgi:two-component system response regulator (stage 0 sporulation protein F)
MKGVNMQKHILIADDEPSIRKSIAYILSSYGYKVSHAEDGEAALSLILTKLKQEDSIDLLVTDNQMPNMSGIELIHELDKKRISLPTVVVSGSLDIELMNKFLLHGCSYIIEKPFNIHELLQKVDIAMEQQKVIIEDKILCQPQLVS